MRSVFLVFLLGATGTLLAQYPSLNMQLLANWDVDTLPVVGGAMFQYNDIWGYTDCEGEEYAILGSEGAVHFIQLMPDNTVVERDFYKPGQVVLWRDMKTYHDRAFSMCDSCNEGLVMYDLSTLPDSVRVLEQNRESFGSAHNLFVDEPNHRLYVVGANDPNSDLIIYDLENIGDTLPDPVKLQLPGGYIHDINVVENIAYASHGTVGLYTYDLTDLENVVLLGQLEDYPQSGYNHSSWPSADGNYLVMADETHNKSLKLVDISDPDDAQVTDLFRSKLLAPVDTATIVHNPFMLGNYVVASYYHDGVSIFDWSDPTNVQQVAYFDTEPENTSYAGFTGNWGVYPFLPSQRIIASDMHNGLFVLSADSIDFVDSPLLTEAPALDTIGSTALCAGESVAFAADLPANAQWEWTYEDQSFNGDTLTVDTATVLFPAVSQRHCRYAADSIVITQTLFPASLIGGLTDTLFCPGDSLTLAAVGGNYIYEWTLDGAVIQTGNESSLAATSAGLYGVSLTQNNCVSETETVALSNYDITIPVIELIGDTLLMSSAAIEYQWFENGVAISGATGPSYRFDPVTMPTLYSVRTVDESGCVAESSAIELLVGTTWLPAGTYGVFPNPTTGSLTLDLPNEGSWQLSVTDPLGYIQLITTAGPRDELSVSHLPTGIYLLSGFHKASGGHFVLKFSKH